MTTKEPAWLVEARTYLGVREIPGLRHEPQILRWWRAIRMGGIRDDETPYCFTGETEILTEQGWQRFDALSAQRVFQVDESGSMSLSEYSRIEKDYEGDVFDVNHRSIRITCDIGHRWWGRWGKSNTPRFGTLDAITADGLSVLPASAGDIEAGLTDSELIKLAAFVSDGFFRYSNGKRDGKPWSIEISVSKARKIEALRGLSPDHEYTEKKVYCEISNTPKTVFRFSYPEFFEWCFDGYKRFSRSFINSLSRRQSRVFLSAYAKFDGNDGQNKVRLYTSSEQLKDDLVEISVRAGFLPSVQARGMTGLGKKDLFVVAFAVDKQSRTIRRGQVTRRNFSGKLYCVTVPDGRIVVRGGKNSAPTVVGNCAAFVGAMLEDVGLLSSRSGAARSYLGWGVSLGAPLVGAIAVLSRPPSPTGGHVGFVVGVDEFGRVMILGANQDNEVNIKPFDRGRILSYRWPLACPLPPAERLPLLASNGAPSSNREA